MTAPLEPVCRYCRCTEAAPCWACRTGHEGAVWSNEERNVCAGPACMKAEAARIRALRKPKPRSRFAGWGKGAIDIQLGLEERARRRRKRKKAA